MIKGSGVLVGLGLCRNFTSSSRRIFRSDRRMGRPWLRHGPFRAHHGLRRDQIDFHVPKHVCFDNEDFILLIRCLVLLLGKRNLAGNVPIIYVYKLKTISIYLINIDFAFSV